MGAAENLRVGVALGILSWAAGGPARDVLVLAHQRVLVVAPIDAVIVAVGYEMLLARLHRLSPGGFEEFCMYLLRLFGMELERRGGSGDEGIDGLGTAPLTEVLSATVAVQVKRYDPARSVSRDVVALFQRDAAAVGAERAVMITLGRFTAPARKAASSATPHVDLIDGQRLCELMLAKQVGISNAPVVNPSWFDRFDQ